MIVSAFTAAFIGSIQITTAYRKDHSFIVSQYKKLLLLKTLWFLGHDKKPDVNTSLNDSTL